MTHSRLRLAGLCTERPRARLLEIGFLIVPDQFLEVKAGATNPVEFAWFNKVLPTTHLTVLSRSTYRTQQPAGITLEDPLLQPRETWVARASSQSAS